MKGKIKDTVISGILFVFFLLLAILNPLNWSIYFRIAFSIVLLYLGLTWLFPKIFKFSFNTFNKRENLRYGRIREISNLEEEMPQKPEIKTYSSIFWKYFGLSILLHIISAVLEVINVDFLWPIYLTAVAIYMYFFCKMINEAMLSIGKKNWWPLGLLILIPFGFWIVFFIIRSQLKPHGKWSLKEGISPWVTVLIVIAFIAIIGILAFIVLVSLSVAKSRTRDARIIANMTQLKVMAEIYHSENNSYIDMKKEPTIKTLGDDIVVNGGTNFSINSIATKYCAEVQLNSGNWYCVDNDLATREYTDNPACLSYHYGCD